MWSIRTAEYDSASERNDILTRGPTWVHISEMPSTLHRLWKDRLSGSTAKQSLKQANSWRQKAEGILQGLGTGGGGQCLRGQQRAEFQFGKKVLETDVVV